MIPCEMNIENWKLKLNISPFKTGKCSIPNVQFPTVVLKEICYEENGAVERPFIDKPIKKIWCIFALPLFLQSFRIELWCNGSTTDFGSVCLGSNPSSSTKSQDIPGFFILRSSSYGPVLPLPGPRSRRKF
jgi:hypothetical protein